MRLFFGKTLKKGFSKSLYSIASGSAPASPYQEWAGYGDSPVLTSEYPYQFIAYETPGYLSCSPDKIYMKSGWVTAHGINRRYAWNSVIPNAWNFVYEYPADEMMSQLASIQECNTDIYTDLTFTTVAKAKTTP